MAHSASAPLQGIKPWYAQLWPWLLMAGPLVVVIGGSFVIWLSFARQDAPVPGDYYKEGKAINQDLKRERAAAAQGLAVSLRYDPASGRLSGTLAAHGAPRASALRIRLIHSTLPEKDVALSAEAGGDGGFSAALPMLEAARWQVVAEDEGREWRLAGVWAWPRQRSVELAADDGGRGAR